MQQQHHTNRCCTTWVLLQCWPAVAVSLCCASGSKGNWVWTLEECTELFTSHIWRKFSRTTHNRAQPTCFAELWHRALAYEAVGLFLAALAATSPKLTQQVQVLLAGIKRSLTQPFQQLPAVIATFAAEAVFVLMAPGSAMYSPVNKLLLKEPALNIEVTL